MDVVPPFPMADRKIEMLPICRDLVEICKHEDDIEALFSVAR